MPSARKSHKKTKNNKKQAKNKKPLLPKKRIERHEQEETVSDYSEEEEQNLANPDPKRCKLSVDNPEENIIKSQLNSDVKLNFNLKSTPSKSLP